MIRKDVMEISPMQIRAARGALQWSQRELARRLNINFATMSYHENGLEMPPQRMKQTIYLFQEAGIQFVDSAEGHGVILRKYTNHDWAK